MGWLIALAIIAALCATVLFIPIRVHIRFYKKPDDEDIIYYAKIGFWKLHTHSKKTSKTTLIEKLEKAADKLSVTDILDNKISTYIKLIWGLLKVIAYLLRWAIKVETFALKLNYGTGDAASTGMLYGVISGAVYGVLGEAANLDIVKKQNVIINPDFEKKACEIEGECIVKLRNAYIIAAFVKLVKTMIKLQETSTK